jgi:hypothetical protein
MGVECRHSSPAPLCKCPILVLSEAVPAVLLRQASSLRHAPRPEEESGTGTTRTGERPGESSLLSSPMIVTAIATSGEGLRTAANQTLSTYPLTSIRSVSSPRQSSPRVAAMPSSSCVGFVTPATPLNDVPCVSCGSGPNDVALLPMVLGKGGSGRVGVGCVCMGLCSIWLGQRSNGYVLRPWQIVEGVFRGQRVAVKLLERHAWPGLQPAAKRELPTPLVAAADAHAVQAATAAGAQIQAEEVAGGPQQEAATTEPAAAEADVEQEALGDFLKGAGGAEASWLPAFKSEVEVCPCGTHALP